MTFKRIPHSAFLCAVFAILLNAACAGKTSAAQAVSFLDHVPAKPYAESDYSTEQISGKAVFDYFKDEKIFSGWNLGNTLDSHSSGFAGETTWGNPRVNQEIMNGVKAAGFDIIRIPVTWMGEIGPAPDYLIKVSRLKRVAEVVEMAHNAGLTAIINLHHDGSNQGGGKELGWISIGRATNNRNVYDQITSQFVCVWRQIALYFKNHGEWLIFEGFNELHDGNWQTCNDFRQFITLNNWNQLFVDAVRSSGGNNESRYLMVNAYCADNRQALASNFTMPTDPAEGKLILSFHYYAPYEFSIQGSRTTWGSDADKKRVDSDFAPFKERFIEKNIPVVIGECGAVMQLYPNDALRQKQADQSRSDYISHIYGTAKKYGLVPIYWDNGAVRGNGEKFGLFDRNTGQPNSQDSDTLIKQMINAVKIN